MKFGTRKYLGICFLLLFAAGCTTYYRISDQATGRTYYTTDYDLTDSGAVVFEDAKSLSKVTLQSSEVSKVSRTDFEVGRKK
jgi:propanediol dehydratase small subunit